MRFSAMSTGALALSLSLGLLGASSALADTVTVDISGTVAFNGIGSGPLAGVTIGEDVTVSFQVDSNDFTEGVPGDTRGYVIDASSFSLGFSGGVSVGLIDPFPGGQTPYFSLVEGFPVSDGFFVSTSPVSPGGVPLSATPYNFNFDVGYVGETLATLDILDALGEYDFTGLTRFAFNVWQVFPDNVRMDFEFSHLRLEGGPTPVIEASWGRVKERYR